MCFTINLPIEQFNNKHRAYFSGEVKNLVATGGTATFDAVLVGLDMLEKKLEEMPDATPLLFLLTDGDTTSGYRLDRVESVVAGIKEATQNNMWMCGMPDKFIIVTVNGDYVVSAFGNGEVIDYFKAAITEVNGDAAVVSVEENIAE